MKHDERIRRRRLIWPSGLTALIFAISSIPGRARPDDPGVSSLLVWVPPEVQNVLHVPVYAVLAWLWCWALERRSLRAGAVAARAFALAAGYGMFDEWYQTLIPGRYSSLTDVTLNVTGALLGVAAFVWRRRRAGRA